MYISIDDLNITDKNQFTHDIFNLFFASSIGRNISNSNKESELDSLIIDLYEKKQESNSDLDYKLENIFSEKKQGQCVALINNYTENKNYIPKYFTQNSIESNPIFKDSNNIIILINKSLSIHNNERHNNIVELDNKIEIIQNLIDLEKDKDKKSNEKKQN